MEISEFIMMEQRTVCRAWKSEQVIYGASGHTDTASKEILTQADPA